jgi:hypothetical protein
MRISDKFSNRVILSIDASDLDDIIKALYGRDPEIEANEDDLYGSSLEVDADFDLDSWDGFLKDNQYPGLPTLLGKLVEDGHIEDGEFIIRSSD